MSFSTYHDLHVVSGGPECNHTMWECRRCKTQGTDIHEWEDGYTRRSWIHKQWCPGDPAPSQAYLDDLGEMQNLAARGGRS